MKQPVISIVMPSFNSVKYFEESLQSVLSQDYPNKEVIVIDGGSSDGTVEIIKGYDNQIDAWVSEPDKGQSDAINRGFRKASGDLLTWHNADDVLLPGALSAVAETWHRRGQPRWLAGHCVWIDSNGRVLRCARNAPWCRVLSDYGLVNVGGPSSFFAPELIKSHGPLDESLDYAMDTEMWTRFSRGGEAYQQVPRYLWAFRLHPMSKTAGHQFSDSPMSDPNHSFHDKQRQQLQTILDRFGLTSKRLKRGRRLSRIYRMVTFTTPRAVIDTRRYRGMHWRECFGSFDAK